MLATKLVDMKKMFTHISGKDHIYQSRSHGFVHLRFKLGEDIHTFITMGQLEAQGAVMVLEDGGVIVEDG